MRVIDQAEREPNGFAFAMLIVYTVSFLLHLPARIPALGVIRLDLILLVLLALSLTRADWQRVTQNRPGQLLLLLIAWVVISLPFVEWPGSVMRETWKPFAKSVIFFFAIVLSVTSPERLVRFVAVFMICQFIRVVEPLTLHLSTGYWGDQAHIAGGEFMNRLSGAPSDVVNPNGLAFVVVMVLALGHVLMFRSGRKSYQLVYLGGLPIAVWVLALTGSRSGMVALVMVFVGLVWTSRHRAAMASLGVVVALVLVGQLDDLQRDRFVSIFNSETQNAATAQGRIRGWGQELQVGLERPVFGHGVGTSREALFNVQRSGLKSHNMYTESMIEIGIPGMILFLSFLYSTYRQLREPRKSCPGETELTADLHRRLATALWVLFVSWVVFHLAQYGLTEYHWYVLTGLVIANHIGGGLEGRPDTQSLTLEKARL